MKSKSVEILHSFKVESIVCCEASSSMQYALLSTIQLAMLRHDWTRPTRAMGSTKVEDGLDAKDGTFKLMEGPMNEITAGHVPPQPENEVSYDAACFLPSHFSFLVLPSCT